MKIKRVIRFQDEHSNEGNLEDEKKHLSNKDALEEEIQQEEGMTYEEYDAKDEEEPKAFYQLKRSIEGVFCGRNNNLIGVFGKNSDNVIRLIYRDSVFDHIKFLGKTEYTNSMDDIYNNIAGVLLNYVNETMSSRFDIDDFQRREIYRLISEVYESSVDYDLDIPLSALSRQVSKLKRDTYILSAINKIKQLESYMFSSRRENNNYKYLLIVEIEGVDYMLLKKLSNLQSSDLIIIVYSWFNLEYMIDDKEMKKMGGMSNIIGKFYSIGNYIVAN